MKIVIQRVSKASVSVSSTVVSSIGQGLVILVGIDANDSEKDLEFIAQKVLKTRLFESQGKFWAKSVKEADLEILSISQFTLYGNCYKGNKPDFHAAMKSEQAEAFYQAFVDKLQSDYSPEKVKNGIFGAKMDLEIHNDGPTTLIIDSQKS